MSSVLIIEDEKDIAETIEYNFVRDGFKVSKAFDGFEGLRIAREKCPSIIILDLMLPKISGIEVFKILKKESKTQNIPVVMLTAKSEEADRILGLELGADDYITKPFSMRELIARIKTVLKRYSGAEKVLREVIKFPDLEINTVKHEVKVNNKAVELTAKEFSLLLYLAENAERVFSREALLDKIWNIDIAIETRTVDVHVKRLRQKLGKAGKHIMTLRGVGYRFA